MGILSVSKMRELGFGYVGKDVRVSDKASFYNCAKISIGDYSRIDDFCVISAGEGGIEIGRNVHVAVYSALIGKGRIKVSDFCNISSRVTVYSSSDDYLGTKMTNPTIPTEYTGVTSADVLLEKHVIIGSGSILLPGVTLKEGAAVGALSLVNRDCNSFGVYAGSPARFIKVRKKDLLDLERQFLSSEAI